MDISQANHLQKMRIAVILGEDPSAVIIPCEAKGCTVQKPLGQMFSMAIDYRMPGGKIPKSPYQCPNEQHFGCSHEHAMLALLQCLFTCIEQGDHGEPKQGNYQHDLLQTIDASLQHS